MLFKQKMQRSNGFKDFERKFSKISRRKTSKTLKISKTQTIQEDKETYIEEKDFIFPLKRHVIREEMLSDLDKRK